MKGKHWLSVTLFFAYCIFIIWSTIGMRNPKIMRSIDLRLFWSYREWFAGSPTGKEDVLQNIQNILFFVPFGALFPAKNSLYVLITALLFSILIESTQYIFALGLCELDDVICNTLGAFIGGWVCIKLMKNEEKG